MHELRSVYLAKNVICDLSGLADTPWLQTIDLSDNSITELAPLACMTALRTLNLANNKVADAEQLVHLKNCTALDTLDLANNKIASGEALTVVQQLPILLLRLVGNPVVSTTSCALFMSSVELRRPKINSMSCACRPKRPSFAVMNAD